MDFLALCKDVARETGTLTGGASSITSVVSQTGRIEKIVNWVANAWLNIQNERDDWSWMQAEFSAALITGQARYLGSELSLSRLARPLSDNEYGGSLSIYDPDIGVSDEGGIKEIDFQQWRLRYARGSHDSDRPVCWAWSPDGKICFGPTPSKAWVCKGMYRKTPQTLAANTDTPEMPDRFHRLITWEAIRLMQLSDEAVQAAAGATIDYVALRSALTRDCLPDITIGSEPLA